MKVFDLHCDALWRMGEEGGMKGEVTVEKMKRGGALGQCFAVFAPWQSPEVDAFAVYEKQVASYRQMLWRHRDVLSPAFCPEEVENNRRMGKISTLLSVEGADFLQGDLSRIQRAYEDGVRMITLTWNNSNALGTCHSSHPEENLRSLTPLGCEAILLMQEQGILVDFSHLNQGGFFHGASLCRKPFLCSHSCAESLCSHSRNLSDAQLRLLGERGGVVGLNFYSRFLKKESELTAIEDLISHARHIVGVAGEESLALGSDFDGRDTPLCFGGWEGMPFLVEALLKEFGFSQAEKICYQNFLRLWREAVE